MLDILRQLYAYALPSGRKRLLGTLAHVVLQAFMQTLAVFSLLPFLSAAADMARFRASHGGRIFTGLIGGGSDERILLYAGIGSLVLLIAGNLVSVAVEYARSRYAQSVGNRLRVELLRDLLDRRYAYFLGINTSALVKNLMDDVSIVAGSLILPALDLLSRVLLVVLLAAMAVLAAPRIVLGGAE